MTKTKKKPSRKYLKRKYDKLWRELISKRAGGMCEVCGKPGNQPHHIIGRSNHALRWDVRNGVWMCAGCHTMNNNSAHVDHVGFMLWLKEHRLADYGYLLERRNDIWDKDYDKVLEYLKGVRRWR